MLVVLDRDGVINEESFAYIKSPEEWRPIPGSLEAIARLKQAGHQVVVATNQSGIARGLFSEETLTQIHEKMQNALRKLGTELDGIFYCPHHPDDSCDCRKPKPGLLMAISKKFKVPMTSAIYIGDSQRDISAAMQVGAKPILVLTGNGQATASQLKEKCLVFPNLAAAVTAILA